MNPELSEAVRKRAEDRCEYCRFPSKFAWLPFQIDHIIAEKHGGLTESGNLAFSCYYCNSFKGPNIAGIDPDGPPDRAVQLFHPRQDVWDEHFRFEDGILVGRTETGRATIHVLRVNEVAAVQARRLLMKQGWMEQGE